jgi:hypothetical protein
MTGHLIAFNDEWVPDHTVGRGNCARRPVLPGRGSGDSNREGCPAADN